MKQPAVVLSALDSHYRVSR